MHMVQVYCIERSTYLEFWPCRVQDHFGVIRWIYLETFWDTFGGLYLEKMAGHTEKWTEIWDSWILANIWGTFENYGSTWRIWKIRRLAILSKDNTCAKIHLLGSFSITYNCLRDHNNMNYRLHMFFFKFVKLYNTKQLFLWGAGWVQDSEKVKKAFSSKGVK